MIGLSIARYMLKIPGLAEAPREDVERIMLPALRMLVDPPPEG